MEHTPKAQNGIDVYEEAKASYIPFNRHDYAAHTVIYNNFLTYKFSKNNSEINKYLKYNEESAILIDKLADYRIVSPTQNWNVTYTRIPSDFLVDFMTLNKIRCFQALKNNDPVLAFSMINNISKIRNIILSEPLFVSLWKITLPELFRIGLIEDLVNNANIPDKTIREIISELNNTDTELSLQRKRVYLFDTGLTIIDSLKRPYISKIKLNSTLKDRLLEKTFRYHDLAKFLKLIIPIIKVSSQDYYIIIKDFVKQRAKNSNIPRCYQSLSQYEEIAFFVAVNRSSIRMAKCGLAAELYRRKYGDYPDKLEQLVPEFLAKVPIDPLNGKSFQYFKGNSDYFYQIIPKRFISTSEGLAMIWGQTGKPSPKEEGIKETKQHVYGCFIYREEGGAPGCSKRLEGTNTFSLIRPQKKADLPAKPDKSK